jgi:hypothetical protein
VTKCELSRKVSQYQELLKLNGRRCIQTIKVWRCTHSHDNWTYCKDAVKLEQRSLSRSLCSPCGLTAVTDEEPDAMEPCPENCCVELWCCCACQTKRTGNANIGPRCMTDDCNHQRCPLCQVWVLCKCGCSSEDCSGYIFYPRRMCAPCIKGKCGGQKCETLDQLLLNVEERLAAKLGTR